MRMIHCYHSSLIVAFGLMLSLAGCAQPTPVTGSEGNATAAEGVAKSGQPAADTGEVPPKTEGTVEEKLPEVLAVNTVKLGGLVERTLGKVTVLNIWATWCVPCVHEMPDLVTFYNQSDRASTAFVSVSIDDAVEITGAIPEFQRKHEVPFPIYVLNERDDDALFKALRGKFAGSIPATFLYDKSGALVKIFEGPVTLAELQEAVAPLLSTNA